MNSIIIVFRKVYDKFLVLTGVLFVLVPISPWNMPITNRDSGVFLYIGWRILNGEIPYRDIWDHKPPIIFYINAIGLAISNGSRWGVWIIEAIALLISAYLGFLIVKRLLGELSAIFSLVMWLLALVFVIQGGNLTTEYALPIQFALLWLILVLEDNNNKKNTLWFFIGLLTGVAFFLKQTTIGLVLAIVFYNFLRAIKLDQKNQFALNSLHLLFGFLSVTAMIFLYFYLNGSLQQFWNASFIYNLVYAYNEIFILRFKAIFTGIAPLVKTGFFQFALIGYVITFLWIKKKGWIFDNQSKIFWICLLDLPIEFLIIFASGKTYPHYYMSLLPSLCILSGVCFYIILEGISSLNITKTFTYIFTGLVILVILWSSMKEYYQQIKLYRELRNPLTIAYIKSHTATNDYVLMWGAESAYNYFSQRQSPSRFVYQYPLYRTGYADEKMIEEYLQSILTNRPRLIIDTKNSLTPIFDFPIQTPTIQSYINEIKSNYRVKEDLENWTIYEYSPK